MIGLFTIQPLFSLLGATDDLLPYIGDYMSIWYWAEPMAAVMWTCLASMRARGNSMLEGKIITTAAVINAILDPIFIFGWFGFPRMEIAGAALATLVANLVMLAGVLAYLHLKLHVFATPFTAIKNILDSWRQMLHVGLPAMLTNAIVPISNGIIVAMVAGFGIDAVAGFGIAMRIEPLFLIAFFALSAVTSPFMGQNFAAGKIDRLFAARRAIARFAVGFGLVLALVLVAVAYPLTGLFSETDAIQTVAVRYLWIMAASYGAYGMVMAACAAFNGIGHPLPGVVISALRTLVLFLPLALLGRELIGLYGLFIASAVCNLAIGLLGYVWFGRQLRISSPH
jgi:putative MATE family efflux protein